jgi:hypothetical protein
LALDGDGGQLNIQYSVPSLLLGKELSVPIWQNAAWVPVMESVDQLTSYMELSTIRDVPSC